MIGSSHGYARLVESRNTGYTIPTLRAGCPARLDLIFGVVPGSCESAPPPSQTSPVPAHATSASSVSEQRRPMSDTAHRAAEWSSMILSVIPTLELDTLVDT